MQTSDPDLSISPIIFEAPQIRRFYELHASEFTLSTPNKGNMLLKLLSSPLDTPSFRFASRFIRQTNDLFNELLEESRMRTPFSAGKKRKVILTNKDMIKKQEEDKNLKINEETIIKTPMIIEESTIKTTLNNIELLNLKALTKTQFNGLNSALITFIEQNSQLYN